MSPLSLDSVGLRWLNRHTADVQRSLERLATGSRINRASDDPAGAVAVQNFNAELAAIERLMQRNDYSSNRLAALEGGMSVVSDLLIDLNSTVVAAANSAGMTDSEREAYQLEADSIVNTIHYLSRSQTFNGEYLLQGYVGDSLGSTFVAPTSGDPGAVGEYFSLADLRSGGRLDLSGGDLAAAQQVTQTAIESMASQRASVGAMMKELDSQTNSLMIQYENTAGARSAIADTDYAAETGELMRSQILQKAAIYAVMTARNLNAQNALALLG